MGYVNTPAASFNVIKRLLKNRTVLNSGIYTIGSMLPQLFNILLLPIFTRYLTPAEYGILSYTTAISTFIYIIGSLSLHSYILRHYFECETEEERKRLFGSIAIFLLVYNLFLLGAELLILPMVFDSLKIRIPFYPYVVIELINTIINVCAILPQSYYRAKQDALRFILLTSSVVFLGTCASLYLVVFKGMGLVGRYYGILGANSLMLVVYFYIIQGISLFTFDRRLLKSSLRFSLPLFPAALLYNLNMMSDRFILERYVTVSQMGIYAIGTSIGNGLGLLSNSIYKAVEPDVFMMAQQPDFDKRMLRLKKYLIVAFLGVACILIIFSKEVVMVLVAKEFYKSYEIVSLIAVSKCFQTAAIPLICYMIACYQTRFMPVAGVIGAASSICLNIVLVLKIDIYGAALSAIITSVVMLGVYKIFTEKISKIRWKLYSDVSVMFLGCLFGYGVSLIEMGNSVITIMTKVFLTLGMVGLFVWRFTRELKRNDLGNILGRIAD
jgi:O-antigen/teichoic acid export membrane protein